MSNEIRLFQSKMFFLVNFYFLFEILPKSFQHQQQFKYIKALYNVIYIKICTAHGESYS